MPRITVQAKKLNKRRTIPNKLPEREGIVGVVLENFQFDGEEVSPVPNPALGKWYRDKEGYFYWGGALLVSDEEAEDDPRYAALTRVAPDVFVLPPALKKKIEQVINVFETGKAEGNYAALVNLKDHRNPATGALEDQITYGRSQTTEYSHLKELVEDYMESGGQYANELKPFVALIGKKPSLIGNTAFCAALKKAGQSDPIMRLCQDRLFDNAYFSRAQNWFTTNGFQLPLSLLVIYDSHIHSGGIPSFLRKRFAAAVPLHGGAEKEWIAQYVATRQQWLANHSNHLLHGTVYRTRCFQKQIDNNNWNLEQPVDANGVKVA